MDMVMTSDGESSFSGYSKSTLDQRVNAAFENGKKQGANEFKQKVLEALPEPFPIIGESLPMSHGFTKGIEDTLKKVRTIISNLEV